MAYLSALRQTQLNSAINLLVNGQAHETPLSGDVIERVAPVLSAVGNQSVGGAYEHFKDKWVVTLIHLVGYCGTTFLTSAQQAKLTTAIQLMEQGTAYETPFALDVIQRLEPVAVSSGFAPSTGWFEDRIKDKPVSTMLKWALFVGQK
jgi:hypothetical protein